MFIKITFLSGRLEDSTKLLESRLSQIMAAKAGVEDDLVAARREAGTKIADLRSQLDVSCTSNTHLKAEVDRLHDAVQASNARVKSKCRIA